ncbi:hypothetical protein ACNF40_07025 [Cuniculiplasma sp. SKW4]|uniref:hypothetical protein n=1 Tax=Cuniculiplasma sp. SKW4 TaxID=3400171 RepID=UPI003FD4E2C2
MTDYKIEITEKIDLHKCLTIKKKKGGHGDPTIKMKTGDSFYRDNQEWMTRDLTSNKEADTYDEVIKNSKGEIIHECHEPLHNHPGHGSAKKERK